MNIVLVPEKEDHVFILALIQSLQSRKLEQVCIHVDEVVVYVRATEETFDDLIQEVGLRGELIIQIDHKSRCGQDDGDVGWPAWRLASLACQRNEVKVSAKSTKLKMQAKCSVNCQDERGTYMAEASSSIEIIEPLRDPELVSCSELYMLSR